MISIGTIVLILVMLLPTPKATEADLDQFVKLCRGLWRAIVITLKLAALTIGLVVAFYVFGGHEVLADISLALLGYMGLRIFLWGTEHAIPDGLHRFLSEKSDPDYLLKIVF